MNVKAAVAFEAGKPLTIETVQQGTKAGEVLEIKATGVCHTDAYTLSVLIRRSIPGDSGTRGCRRCRRGRLRCNSLKQGDRVIPLHPRMPSANTA